MHARCSMLARKCHNCPGTSMRILRSSLSPLPLIAVITLAAALAGAPAAQQPPAGPAPRRAGRGFGGPGRGGRGTPIKPGEECPPGTTEIRPDRCQAPEMPAPSILDYRPHSTLVTRAPGAEGEVPGDRLPRPSGEPDRVGRGAEYADRRDGQPEPARDGQRRQRVGRAADANAGGDSQQPAPRPRARADRRESLSGVGPGWAEKAIAQLEADLKAGAVGIGEIGKGSACARARRTARASISTIRISTRSGRPARA